MITRMNILIFLLLSALCSNVTWAVQQKGYEIKNPNVGQAGTADRGRDTMMIQTQSATDDDADNLQSEKGRDTLKKESASSEDDECSLWVVIITLVVGLVIGYTLGRRKKQAG